MSAFNKFQFFYQNLQYCQKILAHQQQNQMEQTKNSGFVKHEKDAQGQSMLNYESYQNLKPIEKLLTNIIIYSSQVYPQVNGLHEKVVISLTERDRQNKNNLNQQTLYHSLRIIQQCLIKELVYGPSFSHCPVDRLPSVIHDDMHFKAYFSQENQASQQSFAQYRKILGQLGLENIVTSSAKVRQLEWYSIDKFLKVASKSKTKKQVIKELSLEGQSWIDCTPLSALFLILRKYYEQLLKQSERLQDQISEQDVKLQCKKLTHDVYLQRSRVAYLHNKVLYNPVKELSSITLQGFSKYLNFLKERKGTSKKHYIQIMLEYSFALTFFYKYEAGKRALEMARVASGLQIQYTGVLGRRTKYQSFDTAQLVMNLKEIEKKQQKQSEQISKQGTLEDERMQAEERIDMPNHKQLILEESKIQLQGIKTGSNLQAIKYEEDSILLDIPQFLQSKVGQQISIQRALIVLSAINHYWQTVPKDEVSYQHLSTSIDTLLLQHNLTYPVRFCLLLLRSLNEFSRVKHFERSLEQLNTLKDQYAQKSHERFQRSHQSNFLMDNVFPTPFQPHLGFIKIVADKMIQSGLVMSAVQLFQKVGMFEQCIDGLIKRNYKERAMAIAQKLLKETGQTPRLLCMIGDASKNDQCQQYFIRSWELSNHKYPRAQKSLGWVYFARKDFQKSAEAFSKALSISHYQPGIWFTLGCAYMNLKQFPKALKAFSQSICIDETQGQAWANMASCYLHDDKIKEAYATLEQAVKYSTRSWKIWSNLLSVSLRVKQFYKYFDSIEKLVMLDHSELISDEAFSKIVTIFRYKVQNRTRMMPTYLYYRRINNLFQNISEKMAVSSLYWHHVCEWNIYLLEYFRILNQHYTNPEKRDPNDLVSGYQTIQRVEKTSQKNIQQTKIKIVEFKQTQLNMQMCIGWQENKINAAKVRKIVPQYIQVYKKYNQEKQDEKDFILFIKGIKLKLEKCLEEKCSQITV